MSCESFLSKKFHSATLVVIEQANAIIAESRNRALLGKVTANWALVEKFVRGGGQ